MNYTVPNSALPPVLLIETSQLSWRMFVPRSSAAVTP